MINKVVKSIHTEISGYENWTEVSDFLACGLVGVQVKDKAELTDVELNELNQK